MPRGERPTRAGTGRGVQRPAGTGIRDPPRAVVQVRVADVGDFAFVGIGFLVDLVEKIHR